jgi:uncharacterized protein
VMEQMPAWPLSLIGLGLTMIVVTASSYAYLRRVAGWDPATAYFGSIPGALSMTLAVAETSPADLRRVSMSQTIRLFMLVAVVPLMVTAVDVPPHGSMDVVDDPADLALLMAAGAGGAVLGVLARLPAGLLLGAFIASGLLHGSGVVEGQVPPMLLVPAFILLGVMLGLRFAGTGWRALAGMLHASLGAFAAGITAAFIGAVAVSHLLALPLGQVLVAFAPGGLEAMAILALALAVDPAYVAAHHLARFLAMTVVVPLLAPLVYGRGKRPDDQR